MLEVVLERGVGLSGGGRIAGLEILSELTEERGDRVLLAGQLAGLAAAVMTMMVAMRGAGFLQILLDGSEIRLDGGEIARFQILGQLRNGDCQGIVALRS